MGTGSSRSREAVKTPDIQKAPEPNTQEILRVPQVEQQDPRVTEEVEEVVSVSENEVIERTRDLTQSVPNDDLSLDIDSIFSNMNSVVSDRTKIGQINDVGLGNGLDLREEIKPSVLPPVEITRLTNRTSNAFDGNVKTVHDLQAETQNDWNYRKTNNVQKITGGNFSTEEEPSLVWRLGLASPADAYSSLNNAPQKFVETRTQLPKPPSYDPTEEQLMAMIEKEYA
ncbi:uncharacterized protein LOC111620829 isoform X2 [Centruroides sculpturatus]|uniref:uncharacterized protein LOC111620829 isoform X2 n=1 Tax=Centruroides sculpturatus TaxID=218467 RepID=UPI000C6D9691|nr:uncharacterized protein LOC111620829 isoform X2 [Centruroides sculpturatus]